MKFHSPYQFINIRPVKADIRYTAKNKQIEIDSEFVRHDYWAKDGLTGTIKCSLTTVSPLVVGAKQDKADEKGNYPGRVHPYKHPDGTIALPANSLRGMIGSLAENISNSSLRILAKEKDCFYSVRKDMYNSIKTMGLLGKDEKGNFILYKISNAVMLARNDVKESKTYQFKDPKLNNNFYYATITPVKNRQHRFEDHALGISKTKLSGQVRGVHFIRGKVSDRKTHETFLVWDGVLPKKSIAVNEQVEQLQKTLQQYVNKNDPEHSLPEGYTFKRNEKGEKVPVVSDGDLIYYKEEKIDGKDTITELSYSQIWRKPVTGNLYEAIRRDDVGEINALPWNKDRNFLSPVEALFGVVEDDFDKVTGARNLASRLRFTDAKPSSNITLLDPIKLKILDSPKPPSPSMYFSGDGYIAKHELDLTKHKPNGRKHYLPHKNPTDKTHWETSYSDTNKPNNGWKQYLSCQPIPASSDDQEIKFIFNIHFENISSEELGLLQTTIEPRNDGEEFIHRLGLGKPLGLGQIKLKIDEITIINKDKDYNIETLIKESKQVYTESPNMGLVDKNILEELRTLYNPKNIEYDVCYPFSSKENQKAGNESDGFKWFVTNDNKKRDQQNHQYLKTIKANTKIPFLHSFEKDD